MQFLEKAAALLKKLIFHDVRGHIRYECSLKTKICEKIDAETKMVIEFKKKHGKNKVGDVILNQIYGGMRGIRSMVWETSELDPDEGILYRNLTLFDCKKKLPKVENGTEPLPEGVFWLLVTGDVPTKEQVNELSAEWAKKSKLPDYVTQFLNTVPKDVHPMAQFSAAITILNRESEFVKAYHSGVKRTEYWMYTYEDSMNLISKLPTIAALIYNHTYKNNHDMCAAEPNRDWSCNFSRMLGYSDPDFVEMMRLYLSIHADHEGGNVSAHATHLVGSALSDPFLAFAAGVNGLAGPLHGLANQEALTWIEKIRQELGDNATEKQLTDFVWKTLKSGQVVPGYGHAILRKTDPRYVLQRDFAQIHLPDDPLYKIVSKLYKVVPNILKELGKVQNPYPNIDAHSGVLLRYYGMKEMKYYTVLFGVSRALGVLAQLIWSRIFQLPIERPKSFSTRHLMKMMGGSAGGGGQKK